MNDVDPEKTHKEHVVDVGIALDDELGQVFDVHRLLSVLLQLQLAVYVLAQQVSDVLIVDLEVGGTHQELAVGS